MEVKVLNLAVVDPAEQVELIDDQDLWEDGWDEYLCEVLDGSLDEVPFILEDKVAATAVDRNYFIIDDGAEAVICKDSSICWICWRGAKCRVWIEEDPERQKELLQQIGYNYKDIVW